MVRYYQRDALRTGSREGFYSYLPSLARKASMDGVPSPYLHYSFQCHTGGNQEVATSNARPLSAHSPGPNEPFLFILTPVESSSGFLNLKEIQGMR